MREIDIWTFLEDIHTITYPKSKYVYHENFDSLYVRKGRYYFDGKIYEKVITIANLTAKQQNKGYFTQLIKDIREKYPDIPIILECVHNEILRNKLLRMGFRKASRCDFEISFILEV